ncbi:MAG TPA: cobalamin biosynthesis protein CbiG [Pelotomaculum sp.]|nr:cobalamin biosynthesis protein CbiG [Pelotomaculum sp.]
MKIGVVAVTRQGAATALRVSTALTELPGAEIDVLVPAKFAADFPGSRPYKQSLRQLCSEIFQQYSCLVMVMALGIVFRTMAPCLGNKRTDPAVVVMDEMGRFAISALSGHVGGANDMARYIQSKLGSLAVITTATDVQGLPAVDLLARDYNLAVEPLHHLKTVSAAMVNGEDVHFYLDGVAKITEIAQYHPEPIDNYLQSPKKGIIVFITSRLIAGPPSESLFLRPRHLVVGLGCRTGISAPAVKAAVEQALILADRSLASVRLLATIDLRSGEAGLVQAAYEMGLPLVSFSRSEIAGVLDVKGRDLSYSQFVQDRIGVGGVCEPVALLAAPAARLILRKRAFNGVTVAIVEEDWP